LSGQDVAGSGAPDILFLSQEDVVAAGGLDMGACMEAIEAALLLHHRGQTIAPQKSTIHWSEELAADELSGRVMAMPAFVGGDVHTVGLKWIPSVPSNRARGLPRGIGVVVLSDPDSGAPLAFMDGTVTSAMRTGAVSGLAARHLARPRARVLSLLGAGVQSRTQLLALERTLPVLEEIRVWDVSRDQTERFIAEQGRRERALVGYRNPEKATRDADVVVAATLAPESYVSASWLEPGCLFLSVSSLDLELDALDVADLVVTDDLAHETAHPARLLARAAHAGRLDRGSVVSLGAILSGEHPGRSSDRQRIIVSPVGLGVADVAEATRVYRAARKADLGVSLRLWNAPVWL
jgi:ornithine cyclodeaminase/alanine dehydrogenase-like protein (mu-crystallin family)